MTTEKKKCLLVNLNRDFKLFALEFLFNAYVKMLHLLYARLILPFAKMYLVQIIKDTAYISETMLLEFWEQCCQWLEMKRSTSPLSKKTLMSPSFQYIFGKKGGTHQSVKVLSPKIFEEQKWSKNYFEELYSMNL